MNFADLDSNYTFLLLGEGLPVPLAKELNPLISSRLQMVPA